MKFYVSAFVGLIIKVHALLPITQPLNTAVKFVFFRPFRYMGSGVRAPLTLYLEVGRILIY